MTDRRGVSTRKIETIDIGKNIVNIEQVEVIEEAPSVDDAIAPGNNV